MGELNLEYNYDDEFINDYFKKVGSNYKYSIKELINKHNRGRLTIDYKSIPYDSGIVCSKCGKPLFTHLMPRKYYVQHDFNLCNDCSKSTLWLEKNKQELFKKYRHTPEPVEFNSLNINVQFDIIKKWLDSKGTGILKFKGITSDYNKLNSGIYKARYVSIKINKDKMCISGTFKIESIELNLTKPLNNKIVSDWVKANINVFVTRSLM